MNLQTNEIGDQQKSDKNRPLAILVVQPGVFLDIRSRRGIQYAPPSELKILNSEDVENNPLAQLLDSQGCLIPGTMVLRSPYSSDLYAPAVQANTKFAAQKAVFFSTFCALLGARTVKFEAATITINDTKKQIKASGNATDLLSTLSGSGLLDEEECARLASAISINDEYEPQQPNLDAAREYQKERNLLGEPDMYGLYDSVRSGVQLTRRSAVVQMFREARSVQRLALSLLNSDFFSNFGIEIDAKSIQRSNFECMAQIFVEFGRG